MQTGWLVDGDDLNDKPRQGGAHALKGFSYQAAVALVRLTWLLTCRHGLVALRYDGAQDIDLRFSDGSEIYVQAKDYGPGGFQASHFYSALAGFARDVISANAAKRSTAALKFQLLLTNVPTQDAAMQFMRNVHAEIHVPHIVAKIAKAYRHGFADAEVFRIATEIFEGQAECSVGTGKTSLEDLLSIASMELVRFGVPVHVIDTCVDRLLQQLKAGNSFFLEDVAELLGDALPHSHPGHRDSPMQLLPGKAHLQQIDLIARDYFDGLPVMWQAIAHDLDAARSELSKVTQDVIERCDGGGLIVVSGVAGAGKSSFIRRAAWNLTRAGTVIGIEVKNPSDVSDEHWQHLRHLGKLCKRPLLLIIDDVWRHRAFLEDFENVVGPGFLLLASSRPGEFPAHQQEYRFVVSRHQLGAIDSSVADELCRKMGITDIPSTQAIKNLLAGGQMLALTLRLRNSSFQSLAARTLDKLPPASREVYLDLCVGGMFDLSTPETVIIRRKHSGDQQWRSASLEGLIFTAGTGRSHVKAAHALVATAVVQHSGIDAVARALSICAACFAEDEAQRRYALKLLQCVTRDYSVESKARGEQVQEQAVRLAVHAEFAELYRIETILKSISADAAAAGIVRGASYEQVRSGADVSMLLSLVNQGNFDRVHSTLLKFYEANQISFAMRRFIKITTKFGSPVQRDHTARLMENWLSNAKNPGNEACATFDFLAHGHESLVQTYAHVAKSYVETHGLNDRDTTLAAIRLAARVRSEPDENSVASAVFDVAYDAVTIGPLARDRIIVRQLSKLAQRRLDFNRGQKIFALIKSIMPTNGSAGILFLVESAVHIAPPEEIDNLRSAVASLPAEMQTRRRPQALLHILARRERESQPALP